MKHRYDHYLHLNALQYNTMQYVKSRQAEALEARGNIALSL